MFSITFYLLIGTLCSFVALGVYTLIVRSRFIAHKNKSAILEGAIDTSSHGLAFFDKKGQLMMTNREAPRFIPSLADGSERMKTIQEFFTYMFDHSVEGDAGIQNAIGRSPSDERFLGGFREILHLEDGRYVLSQAQKSPTGTVVTLIDITSRKKREDELIRLSRANQDLVAAVEASANGIVISDPKFPGNPIAFVNASLCRAAGVPRSEIVGNEWRFLLDALDEHHDSAPTLKTIERGEAVGVEIHQNKEEKTHWYNFRISPVRNIRGELDLFIGVLTDITELRMRENEFFQSQKLEALGQLAGGIAHDFNNVLSIIDGYTRLTAGQIDKNHPSQSNLERVQKAVERGASLTRQLLTFGRRKIVLDSVLDLTATLKDQQVMLQPLLNGKATLDLQITPTPLFVESAADEVGQIVMNLVINARDAMKEGGKITVACAECPRGSLPSMIPATDQQKTFARLSVIDTGSGMDPATVKKIFDPFFTTKDAGKGTGLGLSVVHGMVKNMGGFIDVVSTPGEGTTMSVYLPLTDKRPTEARKIVTFESGSIRFEGYTVLVAEDEPDLLLILGNMLEKIGLNVLRARDGNEALAVQDEHEGKIDLLITDVVMPEIDGVKLAELFLSLRPETKVIFMSGYPATGQLAPVELPEKAFFMAKPISYDNLLLMLKGLLGEGDGDALRQAEDSARHWH